jgi:hypothetical protein
VSQDEHECLGDRQAYLPVLRIGPHMVPENSQDVFVVGSVVGGWWKEWY